LTGFSFQDQVGYKAKQEQEQSKSSSGSI